MRPPLSSRFSKLVRARNRAHATRSHRTSSRPLLECLEQRTLLNVDMVTNSLNTGSGSLRTVIANASAGDTIEFNMSAGNVTSPITLTSGQINITKNLTIVGPGASLLTID